MNIEGLFDLVDFVFVFVFVLFRFYGRVPDFPVLTLWIVTATQLEYLLQEQSHMLVNQQSTPWLVWTQMNPFGDPRVDDPSTFPEQNKNKIQINQRTPRYSRCAGNPPQNFSSKLPQFK